MVGWHHQRDRHEFEQAQGVGDGQGSLMLQSMGLQRLIQDRATVLIWGFSLSSDRKEFACNARDLGSIPGLRRSPGGENGKPLQYSCLGIPRTQKPGELQSMGHKSGTRLSD